MWLRPGLARSLRRSLREAWHNRAETRRLSSASYEEYRATQNAGNLRKLDMIFAIERNIAHLAQYVAQQAARHATQHAKAGPAAERVPQDAMARPGNGSGAPLRILCHGSRNGAEVRWFKRYAAGAQVLGTDIADTATRFPDMIQWDFHDLAPEWAGAWDVVYSNSWDHAFDPERAFGNWIRCLAPDGLMLLEHSRFHTPAYVTRLDPFGAQLPSLCRMLDGIGAETGHAVIAVIDDLPEPADQRKVVVVGRRIEA
jgi:SAM-dependent methyltransferase